MSDKLEATENDGLLSVALSRAFAERDKIDVFDDDELREFRKMTKDIDDLIARLTRYSDTERGIGNKIMADLLGGAAAVLREQRDEIARLRILVSPAAEQAMRDLAIRAERAEAANIVMADRLTKAEAEIARLKTEIKK